MNEQPRTNINDEQQEFIEGLDLSRVLLHKDSDNILDARKIPDPVSVIILYNCGKCGKDFPTQKTLNNHYAKTHVRKSAGCPVCYVRFTDRGELKEHKLTHYSAPKMCHNESAPKYNCIKKKYKCELCSKRFLVKGKLDDHQQYHEQEKRLRQLKSKEDLPKTDEKTNSYTCKICHKVFHNTFIFKHHSEGHNCERISSEIFTCEVCRKQFKRESYLKRHTKEIHTDETKYFCQLCNKKFRRAELLRSHNEKHHWEDD